jgi:putative aldouronate transport system substrate-binding protein
MTIFFKNTLYKLVKRRYSIIRLKTCTDFVLLCERKLYNITYLRRRISMKKNFARKAAALSLSIVMVSGITACGSNGGDSASADVTNPDKPTEISAMMDTTITEENGLQDVCDEYFNKTGIKLTIEKPDHNKYYEKVTLSFASGEPCDVIEMGSTYYPDMAGAGALWDMTDAWESSTEPVKDIVQEEYVDALKIDGRLYGFPMAKGNGTITYVRQDWLEEAGLSAPKNYDEFLNMLRAFKARGNGTIPYTAAGLINSETPYDIYLREFYQDAVPDFIIDESTGQYIDGFTQENFKAALKRMTDAYAEGLIDAEIVTNKTSTCRDKLNSGLAGTFNYWAGMWDAKLEDNTKAADPNAKLLAIPPIEETKYIERVPTAMAITNTASNPAGIFKYFIEYSHDGGEGQMLFTHGVKDKHYTENADGTAEALGYYEDPTKKVEKSFYAPELTITTWDDPIALDERVTSSLETFQANREFATVPIVSDVISENLANLNTVKGEVIANVVHGNMSIEEGMADYNTRAQGYVDKILADLNG